MLREPERRFGRFVSMYLPRHMRAGDVETSELLGGLRAADLITPTPDGVYATFLPLLHVRSDNGYGRLLGHVARRNDHWRLEPAGESLVIAHGPDAYITPSWYATKETTGRVARRRGAADHEDRRQGEARAGGAGR